MGSPVVHFEIIGKDGKRLQEFYTSLFGWKIDADNPMNYGMVEAEKGNPVSGIGGGVAGYGEETRVTVYVQVPSLEETLRKAESLGGKTVAPPMEVPGGGPTIAQFQDPEGNIIGLIKAGWTPS
jgi:predicted enzyme related to lactoylglutathione lyase